MAQLIPEYRVVVSAVDATAAQLDSDEPALYKDFSDGRYNARKSARALSEIPSDQLRPLKSRGGLAEKGPRKPQEASGSTQGIHVSDRVSESMHKFVGHQ